MPVNKQFKTMVCGACGKPFVKEKLSFMKKKAKCQIPTEKKPTTGLPVVKNVMLVQ